MTRDFGPGLAGFVRFVEAERLELWRSKARSAGLTDQEVETAERFSLEQAKSGGYSVSECLDITLRSIMSGRKPGGDHGQAS
jgi:hypothetical protein